VPDIPPGPPPDILYSLAPSATNASSAGGADTQEGSICPPIENDPNDAPGVTGDSALIGAAPFDLGALLQGNLQPPSFGNDPAADLQGALLGNLLAPIPGFGTAFAFGSYGTVGVSSGSFQHPFTLLTLPSSTPRMGLALVVSYSSDGDTSFLYQPFGPRFFLSGLDYIEVVPWSGSQPGQARVRRGDGFSGTYFWDSSQGQFTSPSGMMDELEYVAVMPPPFNNQPGFYRHLPDGRKITYVYSGGAPGNDTYYQRVEVVDLNGQSISYSYDLAAGGVLPPLASITDTLGVTVDFTWQQLTFAGGVTHDRVTQIAIDPSSVTTAVDPTTLVLDFEYDATESQGVLHRIRYFPTDLAADADYSSKIELPAENFLDERPAIQLDYDPITGLLNQLTDVTGSAEAGSVLGLPHDVRLSVQYDSGGRVLQENEGTPGIGPQHSFQYFDTLMPVQHVYTDPRGTVTTLDVDSQGRITQIVMDSTFDPRTADSMPHPDFDSITWGPISYCQSGCSQPLGIATPEGQSYAFEWHPKGFLTKLTVSPNDGGAPRVWSLGYTAEIQGGRIVSEDLTSFATPVGDTWTWAWYYDDDGDAGLDRVLATSPGYFDAYGQGPDQITSTYLFGNRGELTQITGGEGTVTQIEYEAVDPVLDPPGEGLPKKIVRDPTGANLQTAIELDDLGLVLSVSDGSATRKTSFATGIYHRNRIETPPAGAGGIPAVTQRYYDRRGNLTVVEVEDRDETGALRHPGGRERIVTQAIHDSYDRVVQRWTDQAPLDQPSEDLLTTTYTYTPDHLLWTVTPPDGSTIEYITDGYGLLYKTTYDQTGTAFTPSYRFYDQEGRLRYLLDGFRSETGLVRDAFGQLDHIDDPVNGQIDYGRDLLGRVTRALAIEDPAGTAKTLLDTSWSYNEIGQVIQRERHVVGSPTGDKETTYYSYDKRGRLTRIELPYGRGQQRTYDSAGRLATVRDAIDPSPSGATPSGPGNQVTYSYEPMTSRVATITSTVVEAADFAVPPAASTPVTQQTVFTYDDLDRVLSRTVQRETGGTSGPAQVVHDYLYDSFDFQVQYRDSNGAGVDRMFDPLGRMRARTEIGAGGDTNPTTADYFWNATETKVVLKDGMSDPRQTEYLYDKAGRLVEERHPGYAGGVAHRRQLSYDSAGLVATVSNGNGTAIQSTYDAAQRLIARAATQLGGSELTMATSESFGYDGLGRLTERGQGSPLATRSPAVASSPLNGDGVCHRFTAESGLSVAVRSAAGDTGYSVT